MYFKLNSINLNYNLTFNKNNCRYDIIIEQKIVLMLKQTGDFGIIIKPLYICDINVNKDLHSTFKFLNINNLSFIFIHLYNSTVSVVLNDKENLDIKIIMI